MEHLRLVLATEIDGESGPQIEVFRPHIVDPAIVVQEAEPVDLDESRGTLLGAIEQLEFALLVENVSNREKEHSFEFALFLLLVLTIVHLKLGVRGFNGVLPSGPCPRGPS